MNDKPNIPETIVPGKNYSTWADAKLNVWYIMAGFISFGGDVLCRDEINHWGTALQTIIALAPFLALSLWLRDFSRWMRGMDELHRRITLTTLLFAASATIFIIALWRGLEKVGLFPASQNFAAGWDVCSVYFILMLLQIFYYIGHFIFNRRYK